MGDKLFTAFCVLIIGAMVAGGFYYEWLKFAALMKYVAE